MAMAVMACPVTPAIAILRGCLYSNKPFRARAGRFDGPAVLRPRVLRPVCTLENTTVACVRQRTDGEGTCVDTNF